MLSRPMGGFKSKYLYPGDLHATVVPTCISTLLGSCVAVCIWDPERGIGGMNHYLMPLPVNGDSPDNRHAEAAIPRLIRRLMHIGARRESMMARVFGGGRVLDLAHDIGASNIAIANEILKTEDIPVIKWDVGGSEGRNISFWSHTGEATSESIRKISDRFAAAPRPAPMAEAFKGAVMLGGRRES